jgi:hypothetical protein
LTLYIKKKMLQYNNPVFSLQEMACSNLN